MEGNLYYKKYIEKLIKVNPTTITINRKVKTDDGYGGDIETPITITEEVTFYDRKARREIVSDYGKSYTGVSVTKMLTKNNADILVNDLFTANGSQYKVLYIHSYFDICKQVEVELIK